MKKIGFAVIGLLAANTLLAQTSPLSYDYVEANLGTGEVIDEDFSFYGVSASYSINESIFLQGSYSDGSTDDDINFGFGASKIELSSYDVGVGFHMPLNPEIDLVIAASYISNEFEAFGISDEEDGYGADAGVRFKPTERWELNLFANYVDIENESDTGYAASAYYFLTPTFSVGFVYTDDDLSNTAAGSIRLHF